MSIIPFKRPENRPSQGPKHPPLFNVPPLTLWTLGVMVVVQAAFSLAPHALVQEWGYNLAFVPARYTNPVFFDLYAITSPFTHLFVHGGWFHIAMNGTMLAAFGAAAERMFGAKKTALFFILCGLAGAFTQFCLNPFTPIPMIGASGALSGLFAAVVVRLQAAGQMPAGRFGIWGVAALWIGLSFITALVGGDIGIGNVAWGAHAGGFIAGIFLMKLKYFRET